MSNAKQLAKFEADARRLLARVGKFAETYDSARTSQALGNLATAADRLGEASRVAFAVEREEVRS